MPSGPHFGHQLSRHLTLLRYHQPRQWIGRAIKTMQRQIRRKLPHSLVFSPGSDTVRFRDGAADFLSRIALKRVDVWEHRSFHEAQLAEGTFAFLNHPLTLSVETSSPLRSMKWNADAPRLWLFHLQSQEYLLELADFSVESAMDLLQNWLETPAHHTPLKDPNAWHPFCISRRLRLWLLFAARHEIPADLESKFWKSIHDQLQWLWKNLEWDLGGNHLFENLTTLMWASCFLETESGRELPDVASRLSEELRAQILPSGEHIERTPTYHAIMLQCVLELVEATEFAGQPFRAELLSASNSMARWLAKALHADGSIALMGDSAIGETPCPRGLITWADELTSSSASAALQANEPASSEHWIDRPTPESCLIFDTGNVGCDWLPAHAHADLLQIVASVGGHPLLVDTGNYDYESSEMRQHCRSTAAHNVLQIDAVDHCETWSRFRMGRRGHVVWRANGEQDGIRWCAATHDAYRNLGVRETGRLLFRDDSSWTIVDWIRATSKHRMVSRFHLHPDWTSLITSDGQTVELQRAQDLVQVQSLCEDDHWTTSAGWYCPDFGVRNRNLVLKLERESTGNAWMAFRLFWNPETSPTETVEAIEFDRDSLRLTWDHGRELIIGTSLISK